MPSKHDFAQLSDRCLLVLRHGPSVRLQGVAIVAGYEPPVQRSDFGGRDPRFCSSPTETRFPTPPRVSLELVHHAPTDTVSRVGPDRVKLALYASHPHTL
jgi:hypothetical protein